MVFIQYLHAVATEASGIGWVFLVAGKSSRLRIHPVQAILRSNPDLCTITIFEDCVNGIITQAVQIFCLYRKCVKIPVAGSM